MSKCRCFDQYMAVQEARLRHAIDENKWFMSEQEGRDVGICRATAHFMDEYLDEFAQQFRESFCQQECPEREFCDIEDRLQEMKSSKEMENALKDCQETTSSKKMATTLKD